MTSDDFAEQLIPVVRRAFRERKPMASLFVMPLLAVLIRLILQVVQAEIMKRLGSGASFAPGSPPVAGLPWWDEDIPEDVMRAVTSPSPGGGVR